MNIVKIDTRIKTVKIGKKSTVDNAISRASKVNKTFGKEKFVKIRSVKKCNILNNGKAER